MASLISKTEQTMMDLEAAIRAWSGASATKHLPGTEALTTRGYGMIFHSDEQTIIFFLERAERMAIAASAKMRNQNISARERVEARYQCEKWRARQDKLQKTLDAIQYEADAKALRWRAC